jgi:hypothetical protein
VQKEIMVMITVSFVFLDGLDCCLSEVLFCYMSAAGIVERVVLLGTPISIKDENWEVARKVRSGCLL